MILETLQKNINEARASNVQLYFITRFLKPDVKKSSKVLDKYDFKVYQIDVNTEIREHLYNLTVEQIEHLINKKTEMTEYDVISDDTEQLFTYQMTNKAMSFADVINNQLNAKSKIPKIKN